MSNILERIGKIQSNIYSIILKALASSESSTMYWNRLQIDLKKYYADARKEFLDWSTTDFTKYFNTQIRDQLKKINSLQMFRHKKILIPSILNKDINKQRLNALITEMNSNFISNLNSGEKEMLRLMSYQQQINATELVGDFIKQQKEALAKKAIDGKYIKLIDKNGDPRYYNLKDYTDMVIRTNLRNASTLSTISVAEAVGSDLVQVSSHNTQTPFDSQFEGKIYSLSGKDPDFPQATFLPPFHLGCLHNLTVVFRETLQNRGIQKYIDFSNGATEKHPTFKNFIPVSKRGFAA